MIAILHKLRSMHNVGSIFRTADAAGIKKLYLCGFTPSPIDRFGNYRIQISKVALGAEKTIAWEKKSSTIRTINYLKKLRYKIVAIEQNEKSISYLDFFKINKIKKLDKIALVIGNEVAGIDKKILKMCNLILEIPMHGNKKSLNVSVAFGVVSMFISNNKNTNNI